MYGWEYTPDWFLVVVLIVSSGFLILIYWLSRGSVEVNYKDSDEAQTKAFYYENELKFMTKPVEIIDVDTKYAGQVRREFNSFKEKLISLFLPNYYVRIIGSNERINTLITVKKGTGRKALFQSSWEVDLLTSSFKDKFVVKGQSKNSKNIIASFVFQNELIEVSKKSDKTWHFYEGEKKVAKISSIGKLPPRKTFIDGGTGKIPLLLLATIYETLKLYR